MSEPSGYDDCAGCEHPATDHVVERAGDPVSSAPCQACPCEDYDGMEHPDRPSLGSTLVFQTEDGGIGWIADPEA